MSEKQFFIPHLITDTDAVAFADQIIQLRSSLSTLFISKIQGVNMIAMPSGNGIGIVAVYWYYYESPCTEEAYKSWKFQEKITKT